MLYTVGTDFKWFIARVENLKDPLFNGRVQVRMLNDQTGPYAKNVPKEDLLWAYPISAIQSASLHYEKVIEQEGYPVPNWINAVGLSPTGIAVGTYVFGFYLDGVEQNIPLIFGTYHKFSRLPEPPDGGPLAGELKNDVAKLAQGLSQDGQTLPKEQSESSSPNSGAPADVKEPKSAYKAEYPYNTVYTTKSGHAIELDDTQGAERIHIWHRGGSYDEISADKESVNTLDGQPVISRRVSKTNDDKWEVVIKNNHLLVKGNWIIEVDKNANVHIHGNVNMKVDGNVDVEVDGNTKWTTHGTTWLHSDGDFKISSSTHVGVYAPRIDLN